METTNKLSYWIDNVNINNVDYTKVANNVDYTKNEVYRTLGNNATKELAEIFWLNKEQITKLTQVETNELADNNEVNKDEAQLAKMFGKYDELISLENKKEPLSLASVMNSYDKFELAAA